MKLDIEFAAIDGLVDHIEAFPRASREAARIALNDVAEGDGLAILRAAVEKQVAFPAGYLNDERLGITKPARDGDLSVVITGRQRATSLARFARGQSVSSTHRVGVTVMVKPGQTSVLAKSWLVNLKRGNADGGNIGLAVRLKPGQTLRNKREMGISLDTNVHLLYGPSVDQVFRDVALDETPAILVLVEREYYRQFFRLVA